MFNSYLNMVIKYSEKDVIVHMLCVSVLEVYTGCLFQYVCFIPLPFLLENRYFFKSTAEQSYFILDTDSLLYEVNV